MCDTLVSLTADGVLFAKNSDRDANEPQVLRHHAAAVHPEGTEVETTWSRIPQVRRTHAVLLSQPWWMWGAEIGANEHGVVIGNEAVFTRRTGDRGEGALLGMDLLRLGLERASSADEAVAVIVDLLEAHGQGGSCSHEHPRFRYDNSYLVADRDGAIVLETAGRHWATERVTGAGRSISNGLTIAGFAERYADPVRGYVAACRTRRTATERAAGTGRTPADLFAALRDHGPAGPAWSPLNGGLSAPCVHGGGLVTGSQTTASWVADLRGPDRHWVTATAAPCLSVFKPVTVGEVPADPVAMPTNRFDPSYRWWRHERLHRRALRDLPAALAAIGPERDAVEAAWIADPPGSTAAFAEADSLTDQWLARLGAAEPQDSRPWWLQRQWAGLESSARRTG
jgi:secernin